MKMPAAWVFLVASLAHAELPSAPEAMMIEPVSTPVVHHAIFEKTDWALAGSEFLVRGLDFASTERCLSATRPELIDTGIGLQTATVRIHTCHEKELPQSFVASKPGFAAFSFGMAALQVGAQYELSKHGHRTAARYLSAVSVGLTAGTVANNYRIGGSK